MATVLCDEQQDAAREDETSRLKICIRQQGPRSQSASLSSVEDLESHSIKGTNSKRHLRVRCLARYSDFSTSTCVSSARYAHLEKRFQLWRSDRSVVLEATTLAGLGFSESVGTTLDAGQEDKPVWWLDVRNACQDEIRQLCNIYKLDHNIVATILAGQSQEKMVVFRNCQFLSIRSFSTTQHGGASVFEPCSVYLVMFAAGLLSFNFASSQNGNRSAHRRLDSFACDMELSSAWVCYVLIHEIIMKFDSSLDALDVLTGWIEEQVYAARLTDAHVFLQKIEAIRRQTGLLMRLISGKSRLLSTFAVYCRSAEACRLVSDEGFNSTVTKQSHSNLHVHVSDVLDLLGTLADTLKSVEKALSRSQDHYLAYLDLNNVAYQRRVSRLLSRTALVYLTCTFVNVVSGLFGTNVTNFFADYDQGLGFGIICSFVAVFVLAILWVARKWRILGSQDLWTIRD